MHFDASNKAAPVVCDVTIRVVLILAIMANWLVWSVDVEGKKNILKTVDKYNGTGHNICILLEEDEDLNSNIAPDNHRLVGLHHLHCRDRYKVLIGFRGFEFNNPVVINTSNLLGPPKGISTVDGKQDTSN
jgi:hypothetical protein